jgi:uncharacterized membrane protein YecN with MAPEG domain
MPPLTAIVTLFAILLYFYTVVLVARARRRTGIKAPATTGDPAFERAFRVQMNTLEWMPILLPAMWLFAFYVGDAGAAAGGVVWIALGGRSTFKAIRRPPKSGGPDLAFRHSPQAFYGSPL